MIRDEQKHKQDRAEDDDLTARIRSNVQSVLSGRGYSIYGDRNPVVMIDRAHGICHVMITSTLPLTIARSLPAVTTS